MHRTIARTGGVLGAAAMTALTACTTQSPQPGGPSAGIPGPALPDAGGERHTGTLRGGIMAIGGETTGWQLERPGGAGSLDVDVSRVRQQAERLHGQHVTIRGQIIERRYVERGLTPILVADVIERSN